MKSELRSFPIVVGGDPLDGAASFSRFVLPFAWKASEKAIHAGCRHWRQVSKSDWMHPANAKADSTLPFLDRDRRRYLTEETDSLLYQRAKWFIFCEEGGGDQTGQVWEKIEITSDIQDSSAEAGENGEKPNLTYTVALRPPVCVLFEAGQDPPARNEPDQLATGFLIHEVFFPNQDKVPHVADVLRFNEIFRYWRCPYEKHYDPFCKKELDSLCRGLGKTEGRDAAYDGWWGDFLKALPQGFVLANDDDAENPAFPGWLVNPDDRAFTATFLVLDPEETREWRYELQEENSKKQNADNTWNAICDAFGVKASKSSPDAGFWVKLLNVDRIIPWEVHEAGNATDFEIEWARDRTYKRWAQLGSLYGCCQHAFACLTRKPKRDLPHGEPPLALHFGQMYFDATLLLLYLRVSLFRFSKSLHKITRDARDLIGSREFESWKDQFQDLRWRFLMFENLYQFPLLGNQQQHLELYEVQRRGMDIKELYDEVDKEIRASDEYLDNKMDAKRNDLAEVLNVVAAVGLTAALALGWMDAHGDQEGVPWFILLSLIFAVLLLWAIFFSHPLTGAMRKFSRAWADVASSRGKDSTTYRPEKGSRWSKFTLLLSILAAVSLVLLLLFGLLYDFIEFSWSWPAGLQEAITEHFQR